MTKKSYNEMILDAVEKLDIQDDKMRSYLTCMLIDDIVPDNTYVKKEYVIRAKERIATITFLKGLNCLRRTKNNV